MKKPSIITFIPPIVILAVGVGLGLLIHSFFISETKKSLETPTSQVQGQVKKSEWTCSMHPQVRQSKKGKCPICFMDLIPVKEEDAGDATGKRELKLSPNSAKLAEVETVPVERKFVETDIGMVGKVAFNESLLAYITARMPGRIDRLFVNYTGMAVRKNDHMAEYFSTELLIAQRELLIAVKNMAKSEKDGLSIYGMSKKRILNSVKKKLDNLGLTETNINKIIETGKVVNHITLYAPIPGIVIQKNAVEGKYFKTGDRLFTIADLSKVWIMLDAYESDLAWLRYGQEVEFTSEAYPGDVFKGRISFIDPVLNKKTRTVKVRVDADNPHGKLKPEMFIRAVVHAKVATGGRVIDPELAGKWISPMHPEIIKDGPGSCDVCGMDLVKSESLGYSTVNTDDASAPLVIPVSAPLMTGKRAVVYVKSKNKPGVYTGKEILLGPRAGDYYIVNKGLKEGDLVVVNGNFKIDSALQILAKPSMMSKNKTGAETHVADDPASKTGGSASFSISQAFREKLDMIYSSYFEIQKALSEDKFEEALKGAVKLKGMLEHIPTKDLKKKTLKAWNKTSLEIAKIADKIISDKSINDVRNDFVNLSATVYTLAKQFGSSGASPIMKFHCPMAFDNKGADWLQNTETVANPYYGEVMLRCGEKTEDVIK